ncbi:hypothetical protein ALC56_07273 [Trachymyrmex septentrionalis]|uniref:Uncharacterized protein n=1 Tax=Trachymyrmex septentrionalis TaxID=34720 RepID=A0A195FCU7_9HYME|nr:hypothetical protein ALC56_07273 [Trachymyrmex septentrionalis]
MAVSRRFVSYHLLAPVVALDSFLSKTKHSFQVSYRFHEPSNYPFCSHPTVFPQLLTDSLAVPLTKWHLRRQVLPHLVCHPVYFREKDQIHFLRSRIHFDHHPRFLY